MSVLAEFSPARWKTVTILLPMTGDPDPAAEPVDPVAFNPRSGWPWSHHPTAGYPHVISSGPPPVTTCPDISRPGRHRLCFDPNGWRSEERRVGKECRSRWRE